MSYTSCIQPFESHLRISTAGSLDSLEEAMEYLALVVRMAGEYSLKRILLDEKHLGVKGDLLDAYAFAESDLAREMIERGIRMACMPAPEHSEFIRCAETILRNRSISFRAFDPKDEDEAVAWLTR